MVGGYSHQCVLCSASSSVRLSDLTCISTMSLLLVFKSHCSPPPPLTLSPVTQGQVDQASLRHSHHNYSTPRESITAKHHYFQSGAKH